MHQVTIVVPVKDEEDGLQYLIQDLDESGIREEYEILFLFVIDERTSDNSREFAARLSEKIVDQQGSHGKGDAIRQAINYLEGLEFDLLFSWMPMVPIPSMASRRYWPLLKRGRMLSLDHVSSVKKSALEG